MFSERLKYLRQRDELSQKKLAEMIGFSQQSVAKWEIGSASPSPEIIVELSKLFHVSSDYLLGSSNDPTAPETKKDPLDGLKFALWGHGNISDEALNDVRRFAEFIEQREREKGQQNGKNK